MRIVNDRAFFYAHIGVDFELKPCTPASISRERVVVSHHIGAISMVALNHAQDLGSVLGAELTDGYFEQTSEVLSTGEHEESTCVSHKRDRHVLTADFRRTSRASCLRRCPGLIESEDDEILVIVDHLDIRGDIDL